MILTTPAAPTLIDAGQEQAESVVVDVGPLLAGLGPPHAGLIW
jgi:hypothetical protein